MEVNCLRQMTISKKHKIQDMEDHEINANVSSIFFPKVISNQKGPTQAATVLVEVAMKGVKLLPPMLYCFGNIVGPSHTNR